MGASYSAGALKAINETDAYAETLTITATNDREPHPKIFSKFKNLSVLNLSHNRYVSLPRSIGAKHLRNLKELYLGHNYLKTIPDEVGDLVFLQVLCLTENRISTIPASVGNLKKLKDLRVPGNRLRSISAYVCSLEELEWLDYDDNQVTRIPKGLARLTNLQGLHLAVNQIKEVPVSLVRLTKLEKLYLDDNELCELPIELSRLTNLKALTLQGNQFQSFPRCAGLLLQTGVDIEIEGNPFEREKEIFEQQLERQLLAAEVVELILRRESDPLDNRQALLLDTGRSTPQLDGLPNLSMKVSSVPENSKVKAPPNPLPQIERKKDKKRQGKPKSAKDEEAEARLKRLQRAKDFFLRYDQNGNGTMDKSEFARFMSDLGQNLDRKQLTQAMAALDKDKNGTIELEEFLAWFASTEAPL